jgi:hypothetical protein
MRRSASIFRTVFLWPTVIGLASVIGLAAALFGDGLWDLASWLLLGSLPALLASFAAAGTRTEKR